MTNYLQPISSDHMDFLFGALADPTRRDILKRLTENNLTVSEIARGYDYSLPTISKHLSVLERAQLIRKNKVGREHRIQFEPEAMKTVAEYISFYKKFWTTQISNLEKFLAKK